MATSASRFSECLRNFSLSDAEVNILYTSLQLSVDYIWQRISSDIDQSQLASIQQYFPISKQPSTLGKKLSFAASQIEPMLSKDFLEPLHLTPSTVHSTFKYVAELICDGEINWGRIISLFAFTGMVARHFVKTYKSELAVLKTLPYLVPYFFADHRSVLTWIRDNGGWDGFPDFTHASANNFAVARMILQLAQFLWNYGESVRTDPTHSGQSDILEILARGPMAERAFNRAVSAGEVEENSIVPIVVLGPSRSGKTSLLRSLHGEKFNPFEDSTIGAKIQLSLSKIDGGDWEKNETDKHIIYNLCAANEMVKCLMTEPVNLIKDGLDNCDETDAQPHSGQAANVGDEHPNHNVNQFSNFPEDEVTVYTMNMLRHFNVAKELRNYLFLHTLDFAGQPVYSVTHPVFLPPRGIFLLVYNLENDLYAQATPMVKHGAVQTILDHHNPMTNMDELKFWLSLITANSTDDGGSAVFIVCTHADKVPSQDARQTARTILDTLTRDDFAPGRHVVRGIYLVDNTLSGSGGPVDPGIQFLKADITKKIRDLSKESTGIPIKWLKFEKKLANLANVSKKKFILFEDAKTIAKECRIADSDELQTLLHFLHELRVIILFQEIEMIIIDTQWLLDMFAKVITVPQIENHDGYEDEWRKLEHQGIIEVKFLEYLWSELLGEHIPVQAIITLMEKFSLICKQQDGSYLVPAMLLNAPECDELIKDEKASPLVIRCNSSHLPFGVFPRLFVAVHEMCISKWPDSSPPAISKNFARFYIADDTFSLVLISDVQTITVALVNEETPGCSVHHGEQYAFLLEFLRETLPKMMESFPWMKSLEFVFGIHCPICEDAAPYTKHNKMACFKDSCTHFVSEQELLKKVKPRCHNNPTKPNIIPTSSYLHWFPREDSKSAEVKEAQEDIQDLCLGSDFTGDDILCKEVIAAANQNSKIISQEEVTGIAKRITNVLDVDKHSTSTPPKETIQKCRASCRLLMAKGGDIFVEALRKELPSGMTGPLKIGHNLKVGDMDFKTKTLLSEALTAKEMEWEGFAKEKVGLTAHRIAYLKERIPNCVLEILENDCSDWTVEKLYDAIVDSGADAIADDFL